MAATINAAYPFVIVNPTYKGLPVDVIINILVLIF